MQSEQTATLVTRMPIVLVVMARYPLNYCLSAALTVTPRCTNSVQVGLRGWVWGHGAKSKTQLH
jgi:hypothetical protein